MIEMEQDVFLMMDEIHQLSTLGSIDGRSLRFTLTSSSEFIITGSHDYSNREISGRGSFNGSTIIFSDTVKAFDLITQELIFAEYYQTTAQRID